jgi:hemerythrin-like domain-containing protein
MVTDRDKPADTTMMGVVHDALRRDLARLQTVLSATPPPDDDRRLGLADHTDWMMDFLHHHHQGEDDGLWPLVRSRNPQAGELLDAMEADHARVAPGVDRVRTAAQRYREEASDDARVEMLTALSTLAEPLLPHLRREEDEAMPVVSATISHAEWRAWEQKHNVKGKSLGTLAAEGHWLMDGLDPRRYETLIHLVPRRCGSSSSRGTPADTAPPANSAGARTSRSARSSGRRGRNQVCVSQQSTETTRLRTRV